MLQLTINWQALTFSQLNCDQLYELLKLRTDVFVVEQDCAYAELDEKDRHTQTLHLLGYDQHNQLQAYLRVLPAGISYPAVSIGRVCIAQTGRGQGLGRALIAEGIALVQQRFGKVDIEIGAQTYLINLYQSFGFNSFSDKYMEDGIEHIDMRLQA